MAAFNCELTADTYAVRQVGEPYRIEWRITGVPDAIFINGTQVSQEGHANYTFNGPNYDRFRLVANFGGAECLQEIVISSIDPLDAGED